MKFPIENFFNEKRAREIACSLYLIIAISLVPWIRSTINDYFITSDGINFSQVFMFLAFSSLKKKLFTA